MKKPVKTFHPLAIAKSLEAQNSAVALLFMRIETMASLAEKANVDNLRHMIGLTYAEAQRALAALWPDED